MIISSCVFPFRISLGYLFLNCHAFLYARFYYNSEQINVGRKVIKVVLNLDNSLGFWRDCHKRV